MPPLHHFYHVYADGDFETPVAEHAAALRHDGLLEALSTFQVGMVGTQENRSRACDLLLELDLPCQVVAYAETGWEQVTLKVLHRFVKEHDGLVSYAHTKGSANFAEVNAAWRRSMEFYNFCQWRQPVSVLERGAKIAGCHWFTGSTTEDGSVSGMFGGNYWWARCDALRLAPSIELANRHQAEHWVGRLSEVTELLPRTHVHDLHPGAIVPGNLKSDWL